MTSTLCSSLKKSGLTLGVGVVMGLGLASSSLMARTVSPLPANLATLTAYRDFVNTPLYFRVTAPKDGSGRIWGSGVYTDDSALATAALHAGDNPVFPNPGTLIGYRSAVSGVYLFSVKGENKTSLWGTNI